LAPENWPQRPETQESGERERLSISEGCALLKRGRFCSTELSS